MSVSGVLNQTPLCRCSFADDRKADPQWIAEICHLRGRQADCRPKAREISVPASAGHCAQVCGHCEVWWKQPCPGWSEPQLPDFSLTPTTNMGQLHSTWVQNKAALNAWCVMHACPQEVQHSQGQLRHVAGSSKLLGLNQGCSFPLSRTHVSFWWGARWGFCLLGRCVIYPAIARAAICEFVTAVILPRSFTRNANSVFVKCLNQLVCVAALTGRFPHCRSPTEPSKATPGEQCWRWWWCGY